MSNNPIDTQSSQWRALTQHEEDIRGLKIRDLFTDNPNRFRDFHLKLNNGFVFDYSKHAITEDTLALLCDLAKVRGVEEIRNEMINGAPINRSENRAVLHMALRGSTQQNIMIDGENVSNYVQNSTECIENIVDHIRDNTQITDIVNIGIGGSDLGPRMVYKALKPYANGPNVHFISNIDAQALNERLEGLEPKNTALFITSKTFTTLETITNANTAKAWLLDSLSPAECSQHLFAITMNTERAMAFGVPTNHILPMRKWIGGRFSLWSTVGLSIAVSCGFKVFKELLDGAKEMDEHFIRAPIEKNIPIIMALLGIWYRNIKNLPAQAILPYSHDLRDFPRFVQQLDMESNGKSVTQDGNAASVHTGPIIFGEAGTNAQHAFMQLLHQSEDIVPADFIVFSKAVHDRDEHHKHLFSNALAQSRALMEGAKNKEEPHKNFPGNRPSSTLLLDKLDAFHLGQLIALYEHKIFVQGAIWGINSFDQWGVELGKDIARELSSYLEETTKLPPDLDSSTASLIRIFREEFMKS